MVGQQQYGKNPCHQSATWIFRMGSVVIRFVGPINLCPESGIIWLGRPDAEI